jgi:hypothetical protein
MNFGARHMVPVVSGVGTNEEEILGLPARRIEPRIEPGNPAIMNLNLMRQ